MKLVTRTSHKSSFPDELFFYVAHNLTDDLAKIDLTFWYSSVSFAEESWVNSPSVSHCTLPNQCSVFAPLFPKYLKYDTSVSFLRAALTFR